LAETILHRSQSDYNTIIVAQDDDGVVTLQFTDDGPCQSAVKPYDPSYLELPYSRVMPLFLGVVPNPKRMLVLGLGGGAVPRFFHRSLPDLTVDVVEIDREVLNVAIRYCGLRQDERLIVHLEDGREFIERADSRYDVVILDGFDSDQVPLHLRTLEFLRAVRAALNVGGVVVANVWGRKHNAEYDHMLATYRAAFEDLYILDVPAPGTKIFLGLPRTQPITRGELIERADEVFRKHSFGFRAGQIIAGFRHADQEQGPPGRILTD
jgi:spermidine synthase